jgi:hypothetical protein
MKHRAVPEFWICYRSLPSEIQKLADKNFELLKRDPHHRSLRFKRIGRNWTARVGLHYRAVAVQDADEYVWIWIGHHSEYDRMI